MVKGKQKGNEFELKVAKMLTEWSGCEFHRTPASGALHWPNDARVVSDIVPPMELMEKGWPFSVECKKVEYDWNMISILQGKTEFWKHWEQCRGDAERENLVPLLVFSKNFHPICAAMQSSVFTALEVDVDHLTIHRSDCCLDVVVLSDLLEVIDCSKIFSLDLLGI